MSPAKKLTGLVRRIGSQMAAAKKPTKKKTTAKKTTAKKTTAKKSAAKKTTAKKATVKKSAAKKTTAKKATATKKATAKKPTRKTTAKKPTKKKTTAKKPTKKATAKKTTAAASEAVKHEPPIAKVRPFKAPTTPKPATRTARPVKLDKDALRKIKEQLESERADLQDRLSELEADSFVSSQSDMTGEAGLNEDYADAGTATFDRERDLSIRNNVLDLIDQVGRALRRLDEGLYGTCENCGNPIDSARLKAFPRALLCLDCKRREERSR